MKNIGGEQEIKKIGYNRCLTQSGRSSLRLILESANLLNKRILVPNFICGTVIDILKDFNVDISYYAVDEELSFNENHLSTDIDAFYLIKYFGKNLDQNLIKKIPQQAILIIDDVFSPQPEVITIKQPWFSFNSLRKISALADGSVVHSNQQIKSNLVKKSASAFADKKYIAKDLKYTFINEALGNEREYLKAFESAENELDIDKSITQCSEESIFRLMDFFKSYNNEKYEREENYKLVKKLLPQYIIDVASDFYSFAPLLIEERDSIRKKLMVEKIFLPVHWPMLHDTTNNLSEKIISIPIDSRYTHQDITRVCTLISTLTKDNHTA